MASQSEKRELQQEDQSLLLDPELLVAVVRMISRTRIGDWRNGAFVAQPTQAINSGKKTDHMSESLNAGNPSQLAK
jgi:hypothetical protein